MAQLTYSYCRHEYDRIPYQLKKDLDTILGDSKADEETKKLVADVCKAMERAVNDMCRLASDQLIPR